MTIYSAVKNLMRANDPKHRVDLDLFTYILPFVSFVIDASVKRAYHLQAKSVFLGSKFALIFYYLAVYVCSLQQTSASNFYWLVSANLVFFPIIMGIYWLLLIKGKLS